jgi:hypothetical protein
MYKQHQKDNFKRGSSFWGSREKSSSLDCGTQTQQAPEERVRVCGPRCPHLEKSVRGQALRRLAFGANLDPNWQRRTLCDLKIVTAC